MKKHFAVKTLASVLALLMAFGVFAFAEEDGPPLTFDITVGEIFSIGQLLEEMGYNLSHVWKIYCSGAVYNSIDDWDRDIYGTAVGQGIATITFRMYGMESFDISFNVTAASNPIVKEMKAPLDGYFSIEPLLAEIGYAPEDVDRYIYWVTEVYGSVYHGQMIFDSSATRYSTCGNDNSKNQILLNMKDGQVILINVNVTYTPAELLRWFGGAILMNIVIVPFIVFIPWNLYLMFGRITGLYGWTDVTPVLSF